MKFGEHLQLLRSESCIFHLISKDLEWNRDNSVSIATGYGLGGRVWLPAKA
jgi:hypothetical protein